MRNQLSHSRQRFRRPRRTARQIQNQRLSPHTAHPPAQRGKWSFLTPFAPHPLRHAAQKPVTDSHGGFRSNIARSNPSSARGHDEPHFARQPNQQVLNQSGVVRNNFVHRHREVKLLQKMRYCWSRHILAFSARAGIADRHHCSRQPAGLSRRGGHLPLLPFPLAPGCSQVHYSECSKAEARSPPAPLPRRFPAPIRPAAATLPSTVPGC